MTPTLTEKLARTRKLTEDAPNRRAIEAAVAQLDGRTYPFEATDFGSPVRVLEHYGYGIVRFVTPQGQDITSYASRLSVDGKKLVPNIEFRPVKPLRTFGEKPSELALYIFKEREFIRWWLHVPPEIGARYPTADLTLALQGCGSGFVFGTEIGEKTRQLAYRCLPKISEKFGGHTVALHFARPPRKRYPG